MSKTTKKTEEIMNRGTPEVILYEKPNILKLRKIMMLPEIDDTTKQELFRYYKLNTNEGIPVKYYYSALLKNRGRLYPDKRSGLQQIWRKIRNSICEDIYYDIDMENSGCVILEQYCIKHKIECVYLSKYVKDRNKYLTDIMEYHNIDYEKAKKLMIKLTYLGSYKIDKIEPKKKLKIVSNFGNEMIRIADKISYIEEETYKICKENEDHCKHKNIKAQVLAYTYHIIENNCLLKMMEFFQSKNIKIGALCFDGLMLEKRSFEKLDVTMLPILVGQCERYVYKETGYKIALKDKKLDDKLDHDLNDPKYNYHLENEFDCRVRLFELENPNYFKYCKKELYIFDERYGMYDTDVGTLNYYLEKHRERLKDFDGNSYGKKVTLKNNMVQTIKDGSKDSEWIDRTENTSLGYLLFEDGIYNMKTGKFKRGFDPNIVFHRRIPQKFPVRDEKNIRYAYDISFGIYFKDQSKMDEMIAALARALAGDTDIKKMYFCPGQSNGGKSHLVTMLKKCFGTFVGNFNAGNLSAESKNDTRDEGRKNGWAVEKRFTRILLSNELKMKKSLDGNSIKQHASGGDQIEARELYKSEINFTPHYTLFCLLNDIPEITPLDDGVENRLQYIEFPYVFVNKEDVDKKPNYKEKDVNIRKKMNSQKFIDGFIHIILDGYKNYLKNGMPKVDNNTKENWIADNRQETGCIDIINKYFTITNDKQDFVLVADMKEFYNKYIKNKVEIGYYKFMLLLKELRLEDITHQNKRVWKGLKKNEIDVNFLD